MAITEHAAQWREKGHLNMHDTLSSLVERAMMGNQKPLEYYLREESRLPGHRANLELVNDLSYLLATLVTEQPDNVRALLSYLIQDDSKTNVSNTPAEFVMLCGVVAFGACAAAQPEWRGEAFEMLGQRAHSNYWRVREGVAIAFQRLLPAATQETIDCLTTLANTGDYFQQRAAIAAIAEPPLLHTPEIISAALSIQRTILEWLHVAPVSDRKREDFRALRQALGYTVSVITAAAPEKGFALMCECATWKDADITWILRENLKKKRLAKFVEHTEDLSRLLA